jgi:hypothetical protein
MDIRGYKGIPMRVILVQAKEQRPNHPNLEAIDKDLIEFYDLRHKHTPDGQFITEYYADTFIEGMASGRGLDLYCGVEDWKIGPHTREMVGNWYFYLSYRDITKREETLCQN